MKRLRAEATAEFEQRVSPTPDYSRPFDEDPTTQYDVEIDTGSKIIRKVKRPTNPKGLENDNAGE